MLVSWWFSEVQWIDPGIETTWWPLPWDPWVAAMFRVYVSFWDGIWCNDRYRSWYNESGRSLYICIYRLVLASGTAAAVTHTRGGGWGGVGWDVNVHVNLRQQLMLRTRGVGGWGGMLTFMWTCGSSWCYAHAGWGGGWGGMLTFMWTCGRMLTFMWTGQVLPT